ncbi:MAG: GNAT family N-acetyltransferase [Clostridia bacterium]|nr:GNAT family N-acetyltransferase [Clostridia bacterium]
MKPYLNVVGAAIVENGRLFAVRRNYGVDEVVHKFEFVGGKINEGETGREAIVRECGEELDMKVEITDEAATLEYEYPEFYISLTVFLCRRLSDFVLKEHEEQLWIPVEELSEDGWAPADAEMVSLIKKGVVTYKEVRSVQDLETLSEIGKEVYVDALRDVYTEEKRKALAERFFSYERLSDTADRYDFRYNFILLNGEIAGFYSYCPAEKMEGIGGPGVFLSHLFLSRPARGKGIASRIMKIIPRPVKIVVDNENSNAVSLFKHLGFKVTKCFDLELCEYKTNDFVMELE